jgi:hypothetical protein
MGIPVGALDGGGLLDEGPLLEILGVELSALVGIFDGDVTTDGTTFVEDETIVLEMDVRTGGTSVEWHTRTSRTGTWPKGCIFVKASDLCSPLDMSMLTSSKGTFFSMRTVATR